MAGSKTTEKKLLDAIAKQVGCPVRLSPYENGFVLVAEARGWLHSTSGGTREEAIEEIQKKFDTGFFATIYLSPRI